MPPTKKTKSAALPDLKRQHAYIAGKWVAGSTGKTFAVVNPANGKTVTRVADCNAADANAAIVAAKAALPDWKAMLAGDRAAILMRWFDLVRANAEDLATLLSTEQGKPLAEARGEIAYGASFIEWFAQECRRHYGRTIPPFRHGSRPVVTHEPLGVCAAITPWNFPNAMITRKVAPALAAGCTIILKPAQETPLSALALAALAEKAGLPSGVLNVLPTSAAQDVGRVLCTHPDIRKLSFTGSSEVGRKLMAQCAPTLKRLSLELGGNAPFIVFDDADLKAAVNGAIQSKFRNSGQTCVCTNRFYVQRGVYDAFASDLTKAVQALKTGDAFADNVAIGPLINTDALTKVEDLVADACARGAKVSCGARRDKKGGLFYAPTVLTGAKPSMKLARTEIFGPVAALFPFDDEADAITQANASEHGLAAYVYTNDIGRAYRVSEALEYGMVGVNEGLMSTATAPFGGVKQSGFGREGGLEGIEEYTSPKYTLFGGI
ncbi:MAG: NAD-dependent succinate-semialdehyde dehydrogenase [Rhodospirillales bacterium]|nr:NAD-dependent succinate-semialdehyde dehydrogenase [Alphaproteobacteria bacterium]MCB9986739.1 NAD-dependent succinate-semialdehyde dehydrogenase [Rhodospirillales bacterium]USO08493.1 MAG: NAD-dependent succinate-semialdehyde dehydrogenase [Rhodospirillales bacterium]